jgi:hypothetical protein
LIVTYNGFGAAHDQPTRHELDFATLAAWLRSDFFERRGPGPKDGPWLCFADFTPHPDNAAAVRRHYDHLIGAWCVVLDFDTHAPDWSLIAPYGYIAWTTYKHTPEAPRWRVVLQLDRAANRYEYYATWEILSVALGGADESAKDATRLNYLPGACLHPEHAEFRTNEGGLFPAQAAVVPEGTDTDGLTEAPIEGYSGPTDDDALLLYMLQNRRSAEDAFTQGPTRFEALWTADTATLATKFPHHEQEFDHTRADAALANELAYYTGSHGTRCLDLFMRSALAQRDRFREDKARRAVILACQRDAKQHAFMSPAARIVAPSITVTMDPASVPTAPDSTEGAGSAISQAADFFAYLPDHDYIHRPTGMHWPAASLDGTVGKDARMMLDLTHPVHLLGWAPGLAERFLVKELDVSNHRAAESWVYNQYRSPRRPTASPAQIDPWLKLLNRLYPNDGDHLLKYFADAVQNPGRKCNHAIVLGSGTHGIGKDTLLKPLRRAVGESNYAVIQPKALFADFNPWTASVVVQISEMRNVGDGQGDRISKYDMYERCKDLAAAPPATLERNVKHVSQQQIQNVLRLIVTTNHGVDGIYIDPEDRRHFCAWSDAPAMLPADAEALHQWLDAGGTEAVAAFLHDASLLDGWNPGAPPPKTDWWRRLVLEGNPQDDNPLADAIERLGAPAWVTAEWLAKDGGPECAGWLADLRNKKQVSRLLAKSGYTRLPNPSDKRGRWHMNGQQRIVYAKKTLQLTAEGRLP